MTDLYIGVRRFKLRYGLRYYVYPNAIHVVLFQVGEMGVEEVEGSEPVEKAAIIINPNEVQCEVEGAGSYMVMVSLSSEKSKCIGLWQIRRSENSKSCGIIIAEWL